MSIYKKTYLSATESSIEYVKKIEDIPKHALYEINVTGDKTKRLSEIKVSFVLCYDDDFEVLSYSFLVNTEGMPNVTTIESVKARIAYESIQRAIIYFNGRTCGDCARFLKDEWGEGKHGCFAYVDNIKKDMLVDCSMYQEKEGGLL